MAGDARNLTVSLAPAARLTLLEIWRWNAEKYSTDHADRYVDFLSRETQKLATNFFFGKGVPNQPRLSYALFRRRKRGHGHIAVYELVGDTILVLDFYHTAQDWQSRVG
jgi:plasmid stabilization system protein ParE